MNRVFGFAAVTLIVAALGSAGAAFGQGLVEFPIPTPNSQPSAIAAGPDGALWFTESAVNKVARITTSGVVTEFSLPTAGSFPGGIAAGPDGQVWFTQAGSNSIGRITSAGAVTEFPIPTAFEGPNEITAGPDGALWFTEYNASRIGRMGLAGDVTEFPIPHFAAGGIAAGPDGALWFGYQLPSPQPDLSQLRGGIARITPAGVVTEFPIPRAGVLISAIAAGPDGALWYTEGLLTGRIGRISTSGNMSEFTVPPAAPGLPFPLGIPGGITAGPDGALWFTEGGGIGRITTTGVISQFLAPNTSGGAVVAGPDGSIWFLEGEFGKGVVWVGRISPVACPLSPTILCLDNSRLKVEATWTSHDGTSGPAQARFLAPGAGYLRFFPSQSPELMVKTVDGCSVNNRLWLFIAGLTDVQVVITVTDVLAGQVKTYTNAQGAAFVAIQDTGAFTCP